MLVAVLVTVVELEKVNTTSTQQPQGVFVMSFYAGLLKYFRVGVSSKLVRFNMQNILQWLWFHSLKVYIWRNDQLPLFIWIYLYNRNNLHEPSPIGNSWGKTLPWVVVFIHFGTFLKGCLSWSKLSIMKSRNQKPAIWLLKELDRGGSSLILST